MLGLEEVSQLPGEGRLPRALKPRHEDDGGHTREVQLCSLTSHEVRQLIVDDLHHQFAWADCGEDILT